MSHDAFCDDGPPISQLQAAVAALQDYVHAVVPDDQPDTAPVSGQAAPPAAGGGGQSQQVTPVQAFARQEVGPQWRHLQNAQVAIFGLGAVAALAAESLVRVGVGRILLIDDEPDPIVMSSLGEMVFQPHEIGFSRAQALRLRLQSLTDRPNATRIESIAADLAHAGDLLELKKKLQVGSVGRTGAANDVADPGRSHMDHEIGVFERLMLKKPYDAVLCCSENGDDASALQLNTVCLELSMALLSVSLTHASSRIAVHCVLPGYSCCLDCIRAPTATASGPQQQEQQSSSSFSSPVCAVARSIARAFPAVLPHTQLVAGGVLAQTAIKFLLDLGDFVPVFVLDLLTYEIESYAFPVAGCCTNAACRQRQQDALESSSSVGC